MGERELREVDLRSVTYVSLYGFVMSTPAVAAISAVAERLDCRHQRLEEYSDALRKGRLAHPEAPIFTAGRGVNPGDDF